LETPSAARLEDIRRQADRFIAELHEEYYRHYAGLKETFDLAPIFERHAAVTELDTALAVGAAVDGDARTRWLWRFTCEGYLGSVVRDHVERVARAETELVAEVDGERIPYRGLRPAMANEPDRDRRRRLEDLRNELMEQHLVPIQLEAYAETARAARLLGHGSYLELYRDGFAMELDGLADECRTLLDETEQLWVETGDRLLRKRAGVGLEEAARWDMPRVMRASTWDDHFPAGRMIAALEATLSDLGVDVKEQENVHLDVEQRPLKSPRAFCAPIEVPDKVMLVIQPMGGPDDWFALFHEAGHAQHFAHAAPELPFEARRLGDSAVSEGWATLLQHLVDEPEWLARRLDFPRPDVFAGEETANELYLVRRYCAKLLYELELHAGAEPAALRERYVELLSDALKIEPSPSDFLADVDAGFYVSSYLRSWALEAQIRDYLRSEFGNRWFARRDAGDLLRELWSLGQQPTAEELLQDVTGERLEMAAVGERARERLR
jgi:hypothetical protein